MNDLFSALEPDSSALPEIVAGRRLKAKVSASFAAFDGHFETRAVEALPMTFAGIDGDYHAGMTRRAGGREPWYPRGTEIRNERQISLVSAEELREIAAALGLDEIKPEWLGANLVIEGIAAFSMLPPRSQLFFAGGVTLKVDGQNLPCKIAGSAIARNTGAVDPTKLALDFVQVSKRLRGLVAWVEKPGVIGNGEALTVKIPEQWIYR